MESHGVRILHPLYFLLKTKNIMKGNIIIGIVILFLLVGWIRCTYKFFTCNFEPVGRAEIIYGVGTVTGLGCIIGYIDIEDK
jgi:hypothetical protein